MKLCYQLLRSVVAVVLLLVASGSFNKVEASSRPNIIVFLVDDYDKPETSPYGGDMLTPNLDRLAREGMLFHNAHVTSTVCTPSRYTFLTGRYAGSSYSHLYSEECPEGRQGLPGFNVGLEDDNMNVGQVLADAGYATGFVGKYHVHDHDHNEPIEGLHTVEKNAPYSKEVDRFTFENEKKHRELIRERGFTWAKNIYWSNTKAPFKGHNPDWTIDAAMEFVEEHKDRPFYLHYATTLLHGPNKEWYKSLLEKELVSGEGTLKEGVGNVNRSSILERIKKAGLTDSEVGYLWMDDTLGLLLDQLDSLGIADNTIVVFISDHGSNRKGSLFMTRGTEVPCLVRWPKVVPAGSETHEMVQNTDFVPTWFEVAGAEVPKQYRMDGVSLLPLFKNPKQAVREFVYGEQGPARSIKTKVWNYISIRYTKEQIESFNAPRGDRFAKRLLGLSGGISRARDDHPGAFDADQLYHLSNDPGELKNLAEDREYRVKLDEMKQRLSTVLASFSNRPYGEFIEGGNAMPASASKPVLRRLRKLDK